MCKVLHLDFLKGFPQDRKIKFNVLVCLTKRLLSLHYFRPHLRNVQVIFNDYDPFLKKLLGTKLKLLSAACADQNLKEIEIPAFKVVLVLQSSGLRVCFKK